MPRGLCDRALEYKPLSEYIQREWEINSNRLLRALYNKIIHLIRFCPPELLGVVVYNYAINRCNQIIWPSARRLPFDNQLILNRTAGKHGGGRWISNYHTP